MIPAWLFLFFIKIEKNRSINFLTSRCYLCTTTPNFSSVLSNPRLDASFFPSSRELTNFTFFVLSLHHPLNHILLVKKKEKHLVSSHHLVTTLYTRTKWNGRRKKVKINENRNNNSSKNKRLLITMQSMYVMDVCKACGFFLDKPKQVQPTWLLKPQVAITCGCTLYIVMVPCVFLYSFVFFFILNCFRLFSTTKAQPNYFFLHSH